LYVRFAAKAARSAAKAARSAALAVKSAAKAVRSVAKAVKSDYNLQNLAEIRFDIWTYTKSPREVPFPHYGLPETGKRTNVLTIN
jgi:hypothetical protein